MELFFYRFSILAAAPQVNILPRQAGEPRSQQVQLPEFGVSFCSFPCLAEWQSDACLL